MNAQTGKLIWKTPVGEHNGHDNDSLQALEHRSTIKAPFTILPGSIGGVLTNLALAGDNVYVVTIDMPLTYTNLNEPVPTKAAGAATGEVEALNLATGKVEWDTKVTRAARRRHGLERSRLHNALQRQSDRAQPQHRCDRLPAPAAHINELADRHSRQHGDRPGRRHHEQGEKPRSAGGGIHGPITMLSLAIRCLRLTSRSRDSPPRLGPRCQRATGEATRSEGQWPLRSGPPIFQKESVPICTTVFRPRWTSRAIHPS